MLYRAHLAAGVGVGAICAGAAHATGLASSPAAVGSVFALVAVFSLLPDLDTASVVQRWFYRLLFALLVVLLAAGRTEEAAFFATASLMPLLHKHRGWMHRVWAAGVVPLAALVCWLLYWRILRPGDLADGRFLVASLTQEMTSNGIYFLAMVIGYLIHLAVDFLLPSLFIQSRTR